MIHHYENGAHLPFILPTVGSRLPSFVLYCCCAAAESSSSTKSRSLHTQSSSPPYVPMLTYTLTCHPMLDPHPHYYNVYCSRRSHCVRFPFIRSFTALEYVFRFVNHDVAPFDEHSFSLNDAIPICRILLRFN